MKSLLRSGVISILLIFIVVSVAACKDSKDRGGGFKVTVTSKSVETKPSSTPNIKQPCSLLSVDQASVILGVDAKTLKKPESSQPDKGISRCRFSAISDDTKLFLVLNIYVYSTQDAFDLVRKSNKATSIETNVDEGFYYDNTTTRQSERFVGARDGDVRIGVSSSIAVINGNETLQPEQITLPDSSKLAQIVGNIIAKLQ